MDRNKTVETAVEATDYIAALPEAVRADAEALDRIFRRATGFAPRMWGASIVGYGRYHYRYDSGREGDAAATAFAARAQGFSVYIMPGYDDFGPLLARIGKHKMGKSCLTFRRLSDLDQGVLEDLVREGIGRLGRSWPVEPT